MRWLYYLEILMQVENVLFYNYIITYIYTVNYGIQPWTAIDC